MQATEEAVIWAAVEVETSGVTQGCGFLSDGRPQILFERHIFRRETQARFGGTAPHLSGPQGGYGKLGGQYAKLEEALARCDAEGLGPEPALRSRRLVLRCAPRKSGLASLMPWAGARVITFRYANTQHVKQTSAGETSIIFDVASASPAGNV
jgi:hypothetical protein